MRYLLLVSFLSCAGFFFYMSSLSEQDKQASIKEKVINRDEVVIEKIKKNDVIEKKQVIAVKKQVVSQMTDLLPQSFEEVKSEFKKCLGRDISSIKNMNNIKDEVLKKAKLDFEKFNQYDLILPSGEKRHVDITNEFDEHGKKFTIVQYYKIDDGYPVYLPISEELKNNPSKKQISKFLKIGKIIQHNQAQAFTDAKGNPIDVLTYNDVLKEIKVGGTKTFNCEMDIKENTFCKCI